MRILYIETDQIAQYGDYDKCTITVNMVLSCCREKQKDGG